LIDAAWGNLNHPKLAEFDLSLFKQTPDDETASRLAEELKISTEQAKSLLEGPRPVQADAL